jgi:hypothetical protein
MPPVIHRYFFSSSLPDGVSHRRAVWPVDTERRQSTCTLRGACVPHLHQALRRFAETSDPWCLLWSFSFSSSFPPTASTPPVLPGQPRLAVRARRCRPNSVRQLFAATSFDPFAADGERSLFCPRWPRPTSTRWLSLVSSCISP